MQLQRCRANGLSAEPACTSIPRSTTHVGQKQRMYWREERRKHTCTFNLCLCLTCFYVTGRVPTYTAFHHLYEIWENPEALRADLVQDILSLLTQWVANQLQTTIHSFFSDSMRPVSTAPRSAERALCSRLLHEIAPSHAQ